MRSLLINIGIHIFFFFVISTHIGFFFVFANREETKRKEDKVKLHLHDNKEQLHTYRKKNKRLFGFVFRFFTNSITYFNKRQEKNEKGEICTDTKEYM